MADIAILNGLNVKDATARAELIKKMGGTLYSAAFSSASWTTSNGYSTQTQTVTGLKESYSVPPQIDVVMSGTDAAADSATAEAFALVLKVDTAANSITVLASDTPSVSFTLNIVVWE